MVNRLRHLAVGVLIAVSALTRGRELHLDTEDALSPKQLAAHAKEALGGDAEAAYALSRHYAFFENDVVESNFWLQLSAELGYCPAVDEYVARIRKLESLRSEKRLKRWEERYRESCGKRKAPDH